MYFGILFFCIFSIIVANLAVNLSWAMALNLLLGFVIILLPSLFCAIILRILPKKWFNYNNKIETTGIITEIWSSRDSDNNRNHKVYVSYVAEGNEYESTLNGYSSSFYEGKEIEIFCWYRYFDRVKLKGNSAEISK